ncbi:MAG: hypothetical protein KGM91_28400, partial [Burkholderiales bacterium]|nr:hypothetical protein [Burkholderiales bacterium]
MGADLTSGSTASAQARSADRRRVRAQESGRSAHEPRRGRDGKIGTGLMNIGQAAKHTGVSAKMIRH